MPDEITLDFIARQLDRVITEQREVRVELRDLRADVTVLTEIILRLARDMVLVKEHLGRLDARISRLEKEPSN